MPANWQLPPGVSRGLWEYLHDAEVARQYDARLADTPLLSFDQDFVLEHCPRPGRLIDLGCGTGRIATLLARLGYEVLAVDLSEEMLRVVGEKAAAAEVQVRRLKANLVELDGVEDKTFDYAACMFHTLGMIAGHEARQQALAHVCRVLRPGGTFVLHVHNLWFHMGTSAGRRMLAGHAWRRLRGQVSAGDFMMPSHQGIGPMTMHLFTRGEICRMLRLAGFEVCVARPISTERDGRIRASWLAPSLRAYGFLIAARKTP